MAVEESIDRLASAIVNLADSLDSAVNAILEVAASAKAAAGKGKPAKSAVEPPKGSLEASAPVEPEIPYEQVSEAILAYSGIKGAPATFEVLGKFGVKSGKHLKPEQFAAVIKAFKEGLSSELA